MLFLTFKKCIGPRLVDLWVADTTFERGCGHIDQVPLICPNKAEIPSQAAVVWKISNN